MSATAPRKRGPERIYDHDLIKRLRYEEGYTTKQIAEVVGCVPETARAIAPGRIGKVPVAPLREAFLASGLNAGEVARRVGWTVERKERAAGRFYGDGSRVKRTLGILPDISGSSRNRSYRILADAETIQRIAEAIGIGWWEVMPDE